MLILQAITLILSIALPVIVIYKALTDPQYREEIKELFSIFLD